MRIAVCDDVPEELQEIMGLLRNEEPTAQVDGFARASDLYAQSERVNYDVVLLDIEMESPNGYEIAQRLIRQEPHPIILFVTGSAAYAIRGYGLALRYLLKPLTAQMLHEAMVAVREELYGGRVSITVDGTTYVLSAGDILYAEVFRHQTILHTREGTHAIRFPLRDLQTRLPERYFCVTHQSYIVNLLHVAAVTDQSVRMTDGTSIPISRRKRQEFIHRFHQFLGV